MNWIRQSSKECPKVIGEITSQAGDKTVPKVFECFAAIALGDAPYRGSTTTLTECTCICATVCLILECYKLFAIRTSPMIFCISWHWLDSIEPLIKLTSLLLHVHCSFL